MNKEDVIEKFSKDLEEYYQIEINSPMNENLTEMLRTAIMQANPVENLVSQAASQAMPEPNALNEFVTVNETKIEVTPFEMLKLMVIAFPKDGTYEGKPTQEHWDKIEVWLNNLIKRAKSEA